MSAVGAPHRSRNRTHHEAGFTLIELAVVMVVAAVVTTVVAIRKAAMPQARLARNTACGVE